MTLDERRQRAMERAWEQEARYPNRTEFGDFTGWRLEEIEEYAEILWHDLRTRGPKDMFDFGNVSVQRPTYAKPKPALPEIPTRKKLLSFDRPTSPRVAEALKTFTHE
jgi:hypothetical protein